MKGEDESPSAPEAAELHGAVMRRLRGDDPGRRHFHGRRSLPWILSGGIALILVMLVPVLQPQTSPWAERAATFLALFWFVAAVAAIMGMTRRAPWIAGAVTIFLYAATAWLPFIGVRDLFVLTVLVGFGVFVLAGFNLLFVMEEIVYDIHRLLHLRGRWWQAMPLLVGAALIPLVYLGEPALGISLGTLRFMVPFGVTLLVIGWAIRLKIHPAGEAQLREIHLLVVGAIAGAVVADAVGLLHNVDGILPSVIAYLTFVGTWVYVSYTTLQRAQYFLKGSDVFPWIGLLFSSSFAILAHIHSLYRTAGSAGLEYQLDLRVGYLVFGVWLGLAFFVMRGLWRLLQFLRDTRGVAAPLRRTAGQLARVTEELIRTEDRLEGAAARLLEGVDRLLPGHHDEPKTPRRKRRRMR